VPQQTGCGIDLQQLDVRDNAAVQALIAGREIDVLVN
jgi:hypothetical protein